jgi:hypothetical protein
VLQSGAGGFLFSHTPPLFKCDSATLSFYASKDGKISVSFSGWDGNKVVLEGQAFEVAWGPQGSGDGLRTHQLGGPA